jgi:hypothetical protein
LFRLQKGETGCGEGIPEEAMQMLPYETPQFVYNGLIRVQELEVLFRGLRVRLTVQTCAKVSTSGETAKDC